MEITEDYCSFEVSKLLKEKGFDAVCTMTYTADGELLYTDVKHHNMYAVTNKQLKYYTDIIAPSQSMAMKWLREVHNISVRPRYDEVEDEKEHLHYMWFFDILSMNPYKTLVEPEQGYSTYEDCCGAAIKYCLENLI